MPKVARDENLVTYAQAADILEVSTRTVHRYRAAGKLRPVVDLDERGATRVRLDIGAVQAIKRERERTRGAA